MPEEERYLGIKAARCNAGLTQEEASKQLRISVHQLRQYEQGRTPVPLRIAWDMKSLYNIPSITVFKV